LYKVVTPAEAGIQGIYNFLKIRDSGLRRNDEKGHFQTFYEIIKLGGFVKKSFALHPVRGTGASAGCPIAYFIVFVIVHMIFSLVALWRDALFTDFWLTFLQNNCIHYCILILLQET